MTSDRRRHLRVCVPGAFCDLIVGGVSVGLVSVEDVSESGVFLAVPHPVVPVRTAVELRFIEEAAPFVLIGTIVQVVAPGGPRASGYGIELVVPPANTVERVAEKMPRAPAPVLTSMPPLPTVIQPKAPETPAAVLKAGVVILGPTNGLGAAMARALSLFDVDASFSADARSAIAVMDKQTRLVLVELRLLEALGMSLAHIRTGAPKARIMVAVDALPDAETRGRLLRQGGDELLLLPLDPFAVMGKIHGLARARR